MPTNKLGTSFTAPEKRLPKQAESVCQKKKKTKENKCRENGIEEKWHCKSFDCVFDLLYLTYSFVSKIALWHFMFWKRHNDFRSESNEMKWNKWKRKRTSTKIKGQNFQKKILWVEKLNEEFNRFRVYLLICVVVVFVVFAVLVMYLICGIVHYCSLFCEMRGGAFNSIQIGFAKDISMWPKSKGYILHF